MRLWNYLLALAMALCLLVSVTALAADEEPVAPEDEAPSFTNPAQAQHAANVAEASFSEQDEAQVESYAAEYAESFVQQKADEYATGLGYVAGTPEYQEAYDAAYARATNPEYHNAYDSAYEKAYADGVSRITGAKLEDIERYRYEDGMGWGEIAKMYDVHPGVLGRGHAKKSTVAPEDEIEAVTRRNTRTGWDDATSLNTHQNRYRYTNADGEVVGLTGTSGEFGANSVAGKGKSTNYGQAKKMNSSTSTSGSSKNASKDKGNNSNKGSDKGNKGGNSGNSGNNGNSGGNGKNK